MKVAGCFKPFTGRVATVAVALLTLGAFGQGQEPRSKASKQAAVASPSHESSGAVESWSTLAVDRKVLHYVPPVLADRGEFKDKGFIRERYTVNWRTADPFDLYVVRPIGVEKPPVILYLYSFPDDTDVIKTDRWAEVVTSKGYAAVAFVSSLTGHRLRYKEPKESLVTEMDRALTESTHDVQLILDYVATRKDLDSTRIGMFGAGSGGSIAILASAVDPRIQAVDLLSPWGDWAGWFANSQIIDEKLRADFLKPEYLAKVTPLDPVLWFPKMQARIVRLQDIRKNKSMPDASQEKFEAAAPEFAFIEEYGNGRAYLTLQPSLIALDWLKDQLKPGANPVIAKDPSKRIHFYPALENAATTAPGTSAGGEKVPGTTNN